MNDTATFKAEYQDYDGYQVEYFGTLEEAREWVEQKSSGADTWIEIGANIWSGTWENFDGEEFELSAQIVVS